MSIYNGSVCGNDCFFLTIQLNFCHNYYQINECTEQIKLFENGSLECLYNTTHIYFMFQTSVGFNFIKKPKVFDYDKTIEIPTLDAINRIKQNA